MILRPRVAEQATFPSDLTTVDNVQINVEELAAATTLICLTMKAFWCPVCPELLKSLSFMGFASIPHDITFPLRRHATETQRQLEINQDEFNLNHLLLSKDAKFIVICPGNVDQVKELRQRVEESWLVTTNIISNDKEDGRDTTTSSSIPSSNWNTAYFVADPNLALADRLGLKSGMGMWPSTLRIRYDLTVETIEIGRGPRHLGETALLDYLKRQRLEVESSAMRFLSFSQQLLRECLPSLSNTAEIYTYHLPIELLDTIFAYCDIQTLTTLTRVCTSWHLVSIDQLHRRFNRVMLSVWELMPKTTALPQHSTPTLKDETWTEGLVVMDYHTLEYPLKNVQFVFENVRKLFRNVHELDEMIGEFTVSWATSKPDVRHHEQQAATQNEVKTSQRESFDSPLPAELRISPFGYNGIEFISTSQVRRNGARYLEL